MRILFLNGHPVWTHGLPWGFRQLGHDVRIVDILQEDYLTKYMEVFQPDLLITVGWIYEYTVEKLKMINKIIKESGCLHVYWATEDINNFEKWSLPMVKHTQPDLVFTINADCISKYQELGITAFHLDFGYNTSLEPSLTELHNPKFDHDLALIANTYDGHPFREKSIQILVRPLIERGYDLVLCGKGWEKASWLNEKLLSKIHYLGPISFEDTFKAYKGAKVIINLQNQNQHLTQVTLRTFEIMGCGGFQLTSRTPAVEKLFINGHHLIMSSSPEETIQLVDYYLSHKNERNLIATQGQGEILAKHTYDKRAAYILSCLNGIKERKKRYPLVPHSSIKEKNLCLKIIHPPIADVFIKSSNRRLEKKSLMAIGRKKSKVSGWITARSYLKFKLGKLPLDAEFIAAYLYLNLRSKRSKEDTIGCYPVLGSWRKGIINWTKQPLIGTKPVYQVKVQKNQEKKWFSWDITPLVQKWLKKSTKNHGICLRSINETVKEKNIQTFVSSNKIKSQQKPYIAILYFSKMG